MREERMAKYINLLNWTDQGIKTFDGTIDRAEAARKLAADMGGSLEIYWTVGEFDMVAISEFPNDETATGFLLKVGALGSVRSRSMRAFDADEMSRIVSSATS
jgi:uncharacterized protein with GYD domain